MGIGAARELVGLAPLGRETAVKTDAEARRHPAYTRQGVYARIAYHRLKKLRTGSQFEGQPVAEILGKRPVVGPALAHLVTALGLADALEPPTCGLAVEGDIKFTVQEEPPLVKQRPAIPGQQAEPISGRVGRVAVAVHLAALGGHIERAGIVHGLFYTRCPAIPGCR